MAKKHKSIPEQYVVILIKRPTKMVIQFIKAASAFFSLAQKMIENLFKNGEGITTCIQIERKAGYRLLNTETHTIHCVNVENSSKITQAIKQFCDARAFSTYENVNVVLFSAALATSKVELSELKETIFSDFPNIGVIII